MKLFCFPCEVQHREFDSKLLLASRIASSSTKFACLVGFDKYFNEITRNIPNLFLLDKSMSTIMLHGRIKPCKDNGGTVFINDEEGVNDLEETPHALDIRADPSAVDYVDRYLAWGAHDAEFFGSRKPGLAKKISITGSHRYDLLNDIGRSIYQPEINSIKTIFGNFILYNDNLAVDHYTKKYTPPLSLYNASPNDFSRAKSEWDNLEKNHTSRRMKVQKFLLDLANRGYSIIIRPHPVFDPLFWYESFRLHPRVQIIYKGSVEPWIHSASSVITTGCTTGLQALLADRPSFEIDLGEECRAFSSQILPKCNSSFSFYDTNHIDYPSFAKAKQQLYDRWIYGNSSTQLISKLILESSQGLNDVSNIEFLSNIKRLNIAPPKWRDLTTNDVINRFKRIIEVLNLDSSLKCKKVTNGLYLIFK